MYFWCGYMHTSAIIPSSLRRVSKVNNSGTYTKLSFFSTMQATFGSMTRRFPLDTQSDLDRFLENQEIV